MKTVSENLNRFKSPNNEHNSFVFGLQPIRRLQSEKNESYQLHNSQHMTAEKEHVEAQKKIKKNHKKPKTITRKLQKQRKPRNGKTALPELFT